jgi:hypothetical protein
MTDRGGSWEVSFCTVIGTIVVSAPLFRAYHVPSTMHTYICICEMISNISILQMKRKKQEFPKLAFPI